jgi:predicted nucleic acid-binding protein
VSGNYLLDTNIVIALFADETAVKDNLAKAEEVFIPSIAIGELCYGAHKSVRAMRYGNGSLLWGDQKCVTSERTSCA